MQIEDPIVIVSYSRTPIGAMQGKLASLSACDLGAATLKANIEQSGIDPKNISEVIMGCILSAGLGQAPARQASIYANIPNSVGATTINKMCGSGMKAVMLGVDSIKANTNKVVLAGGMESMTNAPYLIPKARGGIRLGHDKLYDHMFFDGLEDPFNNQQLMGVFAENTATKYNITRKQQDDFALSSLTKAITAIKDGIFVEEITPLTIKNKKETIEVKNDEIPYKSKPEKIPLLKPAFVENGTVTAANSSSLADGASSLLLMKQSTAKEHKLKPLAKIVSHSTFSCEPAWFTTAPIYAIENLLSKSNWDLNDVDLFEINEAFAVVSLVTMQELKIDSSKVNIFGGACALGHPLGASGARIICSLLTGLNKKNKNKGIATCCIGGGEASAIAIERL